MRIAIVDDVAEERQQLRERLNKLLQLHSLDGQLLEFDNSTSFLHAAKDCPFALAFLDIYMEGESGMEAAQQLRQFDKDCMIVFTTSSTDHAVEGFEVKALQYLVKPYSEEKLADTFADALRRLPTLEKYIEVRTAGGTEKIRLKQILYAEHFDHRIYVHLSDGQSVTTARMTFDEFTDTLCGDSRFFTAGRGLLVNLEQAEDFNGTAFLMADGKQIPVSRGQQKNARSAFAGFLFGRGRGL